MLFGQNRDAMRRFYQSTWHKRLRNEPLQPLEAMIARVIELHPEYHPLINNEEALQQEFTPESGQSNPFLHMGLHIALQEQLSIDRPQGIAAVHQRLLQRSGDVHAVEHEMMECLIELIWRTQQAGTAPDEAQYLECLNRLL